MVPTDSSGNFEKLVKESLENNGFTVELTREHGLDLIAKKNGKNYGVELKRNREGILQAITQLISLKAIPEIDFLYVGAPEKPMTPDIQAISKNDTIGIGLFTISDEGHLNFLVEPKERPPARVTWDSFSISPNVFSGESFQIEATLRNSGGKTATDINVDCIPIGPFEPKIQEIKKIEKLIPQNRRTISFTFKVLEDAIPEKYFIFFRMSKGQEVGELNPVDVIVRRKDSEFLEKLISDAVSNLDEALHQTPLQLLEKINASILDGTIDINTNIYDKSIWNSLGMAYLQFDLPKQASIVYDSMVKTLLQYETAHKTRIHKGLAYNNLGVTLYKLGKLEEAKEAFKKAYEEDIKSYGEEAAKDSLAKKTLDSMQTEKKT